MYSKILATHSSYKPMKKRKKESDIKHNRMKSGTFMIILYEHILSNVTLFVLEYDIKVTCKFFEDRRDNS